jgi:hypothetical protein
MERFLISERFRLELHWAKAVYKDDGVCNLFDAYFSGPALREAQQLKDNDHISLDFYSQYVILTKGVYVADFSWGKVEYKPDGSIWLFDAKLKHDTELNRVPKLKSDDYLVIDTSDHETEKHAYNMVYKTYVVNETTSLYNFGGK